MNFERENVLETVRWEGEIVVKAGSAEDKLLDRHCYNGMSTPVGLFADVGFFGRARVADRRIEQGQFGRVRYRILGLCTSATEIIAWAREQP